jgi:hypothetical protein
MGALRSAEELQEALQLVVAAYRDIGPPPADDEAVSAWAQQYGDIADLAGQLTGARARYALALLRKLAAARRGTLDPDQLVTARTASSNGPRSGRSV